VKFLVTTAGADSTIEVRGIGRNNNEEIIIKEGGRPVLSRHELRCLHPRLHYSVSALLVVSLESLVNAFRNGEGSLIQHCSKHADIRGTELLYGFPRRIPAGRVRLDHENYAVQ
jgi:hypothetical protein